MKVIDHLKKANGKTLFTIVQTDEGKGDLKIFDQSDQELLEMSEGKTGDARGMSSDFADVQIGDKNHGIGYTGNIDMLITDKDTGIQMLVNNEYDVQGDDTKVNVYDKNSSQGQGAILEIEDKFFSELIAKRDGKKVPLPESVAHLEFKQRS